MSHWRKLYSHALKAGQPSNVPVQLRFDPGGGKLMVEPDVLENFTHAALIESLRNNQSQYSLYIYDEIDSSGSLSGTHFVFLAFPPVLLVGRRAPT